MYVKFLKANTQAPEQLSRSKIFCWRHNFDERKIGQLHWFCHATGLPSGKDTFLGNYGGAHFYGRLRRLSLFTWKKSAKCWHRRNSHAFLLNSVFKWSFCPCCPAVENRGFFNKSETFLIKRRQSSVKWDSIDRQLFPENSPAHLIFHHSSEKNKKNEASWVE